jgi:hypothetical protein
MQVDWNVEKDLWLRKVRGLSFQLVEEAIELDEVVDDTDHPSPLRPNQRIIVIRVNGRCVGVPYVPDGSGGGFLKTMYFSRDLDKEYGGTNE